MSTNFNIINFFLLKISNKKKKRKSIYNITFQFSIIILFTYLYVHTCSIINNSELCKCSVKENLGNMKRWRSAQSSHQICEVASLITGSTDYTEPTEFVWKTLRLPCMHIHIEFVKAKIRFLLIHDVIADSCWFSFSASSSARRLQNLLSSFRHLHMLT